MDVELFLEGRPSGSRIAHTGWSCYMRCLGMLLMKGGKKQSEWSTKATRNLPKLDPEADLCAVQLVGPKTMKEEILSLYLEVYKQQRLPGSLPGEPALTKEVVSSFKDHQGQKEERAPGVTAGPQSANARPLKSQVTGKGETSIARSLAPIKEAHQKVLATTAAIKGEIERLSHPLLQSWPEPRTRSKSRDWKRRHHQVWFTNNPASYHPPPRSPESSKGEVTTDDLELGEPPELEPWVTFFMKVSAETSE